MSSNVKKIHTDSHILHAENQAIHGHGHMFRSQQCRILGEIEDVGSAITPECAQVSTNIK
jgi:hypothetical protein